jgi:pyruvate dehydrogenase E1 component beta subunit
MLQQAIASDDPIVYFEPKRRYYEKDEIDTSATEAPYPLHASRVVREGTDVTLLSYGPMVKTCLEAAAAADEEGRSLEVIDLRTLSPLDLGPVYESVRRTGRAITVHEAPNTLGLGAELAARITEECFFSLEAPVLRVSGFDTPYPAAKLEEDYLPDLDRVLDAVDRTLAF